jgi:hypothetical protein
MVTTTYVYDDCDPSSPPARPPGTPARVVSAIQSPAYTPQDLALLLGLQQHEGSLCHGCKQPREVAWHAEMDGWYEPESFVCHACTARNPDGQKAIYTLSVNTRNPSKGPLPEFVLGKTTSSD